MQISEISVLRINIIKSASKYFWNLLLSQFIIEYIFEMFH